MRNAAFRLSPMKRKESEILQQESAQVENNASATIATDSNSSTLPDNTDNEEPVGTDTLDADSVETNQKKETEDIRFDADGQTAHSEMLKKPLWRRSISPT